MARPQPAYWTNWARNQQVTSARVQTPQSLGELVDVLRCARQDGLAVKAVGSGHSFTSIAVAEGVRVELTALAEVHAVDRAAGTVTVGAGLPLWRLNDVLAAHGLALTNMGDVAYQTVSGAISTGTHGTGRDSAGLAQQVVALQLVLADGSVVDCSEQVEPELFAVARLGLGAFGIITRVTVRVEPAYLLHAREGRAALGETLAALEDTVESNEHFELYWLPFTDTVLAKRNNRSAGPPRPMSAGRLYWESIVLENRLLALTQRLGRARPALVPPVNRVLGHLVSGREYVDDPHRVYTSRREVRFLEMEYALPREHAVAVIGELRDLVAAGPWRVGFPLEVRFAPADDVWLSTAHGRDTVYVAVHAFPGTEWHGYFQACEELFVRYAGRPHWGKLHTRSAAELRRLYERFDDALAVRERVDPERLFGNAYLERVLGP